MDQLHALVVDDDIINRMLVKKLLLKSSCTVTAVDCGGKALQELGLDNNENNPSTSSLKVDLIISDYSMPEMTGFELLQKIKSSSTHRHIPMVIMSSENIEARILRCLEEGAQDFILKPVKMDDITRLKDSILGHLPAEQQPITRPSNESTSQVDNLPESAGQCSSKVCESSSVDVAEEGEDLSIVEEV
ncbi:two-component response regulator ORR3-like [Bidens hawaiensis]|uniref:two-component response regulator ORR3-like n=1 Tax=Bidens hawaiensis TaxID=980011 RepID=UPI00404B9AC5